MAPRHCEETVAETKERWRFHWNHLHDEVVATDICSGCAGCVLSCPHDVLGYDEHWHPVLAEEARVGGEAQRCVHGEKTCTMCTRACPRFRAWEPEVDTHLWGRPRDAADAAETIGVHQDILLARTTNPDWQEQTQDGGLCSATLVYALRHGYIDAALVGTADEKWRTAPGVAWTEADVLAAAGSRYTYTPNTLAFDEAIAGGAEKLALVGMGCMASVPATMMTRGSRKAGKRFALTIGLLCSKSFDDDVFEGLLKEKYDLERTDIVKMNIKGKLQLWLRPGVREGDYLEVPLKECHEFTRPGCNSCPDFAAEHADISMGGLGQAGWTLTIVRTDVGRQLLDEMARDGWVECQPAVDADPAAVELMRKLAVKSRKRWPVGADSGRPDADLAPGRTPPAG